VRHLLRLLVLVVLLSGLAGLASARAHAAPLPPCPDPKAVTFSGTHFDVTFDDASGATDAVSQQEASAVLAAAERAYATFTGLGFPAPATYGATGKTEIDISDLSAWHLSSLYCSGAFLFDKAPIGTSGLDAAVAADVFGEIAYAFGNPDSWIVQGFSEWGSWLSVGYPAESTTSLGPWELSLDCQLTNHVDPITCDAKDSYVNLGLTRWPFYEYLWEKFGKSFMVELIQDSGVMSGLTALQTALGNHGTSLAAEYNAFTTKLLVGGWTATQLNTTHPPITGSPILTGAKTGDTPTQSFGVSHLATKYVQIDRGDGDADHKCYTATLTVKVTLPSGLDTATSKPVFYWGAADNTPVSLSGSGSTLSASVPWDTCTWETHGYLSLPNASTTLNGAVFQVSTHVDVTSTETTAAPPTLPSNTYGNSTDSGSAQGAVPAISLLGPQTLKLKSTATTLTVVVQSTDQGLVAASLGSSDLGRLAIVPGTNKLTFKLASGILRKLRVSSATGDRTLTLTPLSSDGKVAGTAATLKVAVVQAPTQKLKVKKTKKRR
jgi:hypothetical protein